MQNRNSIDLKDTKNTKMLDIFHCFHKDVIFNEEITSLTQVKKKRCIYFFSDKIWLVFFEKYKTKYGSLQGTAMGDITRTWNQSENPFITLRGTKWKGKVLLAWYCQF